MTILTTVGQPEVDQVLIAQMDVSRRCGRRAPAARSPTTPCPDRRPRDPRRRPLRAERRQPPAVEGRVVEDAGAPAPDRRPDAAGVGRLRRPGRPSASRRSTSSTTPARTTSSTPPTRCSTSIETVPVVLAVAADLRRIALMDGDVGRAPMMGGASIYPFCWSILLAAHGRGLGGVLTTFLSRAEPAAAPLLRPPRAPRAGGDDLARRPRPPDDASCAAGRSSRSPRWTASTASRSTPPPTPDATTPVPPRRASPRRHRRIMLPRRRTAQNR